MGKLGLAVAIVLGFVVAMSPWIIEYLASISRERVEVPTSVTSIRSEVTTVATGGAKVVELGCGESQRGADRLVVCPAKIVTDRSGVVVKIVATVYFKHYQPCPYPRWKIVVENLNNVALVNESDVEVSGRTATKAFFVKILGNGSMDVVFYYGHGCPYGTEERVRVEFIVSLRDAGSITSSTSYTGSVAAVGSSPSSATSFGAGNESVEARNVSGAIES